MLDFSLHAGLELDDAAADRLLAAAYERMGLSGRSYDRLLRVARTIADLEGGGPIQVSHLAEAIQYRASGYLQR